MPSRNETCAGPTVASPGWSSTISRTSVSPGSTVAFAASSRLEQKVSGSVVSETAPSRQTWTATVASPSTWIETSPRWRVRSSSAAGS
jgi:hypothetical protein